MKAFTLLLLVALMLAAGCRAPGPGQEMDTRSVAANPRPEPGTPAERARAHTELGASYLQIGRFGVALQELQEAIKADPNYVPAYSTLGLVYMELREDAKAKASFERALKIDPADSDTNNNYGLFLCDRKKEKEGVRYFLAALKNPLYATPEDSYVNAGICSRRAGDDAAAQLYLERALKIQPNDGRALVHLARVHFDRRQMNLAKSYMTKFMQNSKNADAASLWLAARIEQALGDRAAVASYGSQLKSKFPDSQEARLFTEGIFE
ncbi:MAG: type IV pilus biogenesis/stability protein PilW [Betaproteobacteria bacterium]|nr:type IV pilus biogenesis/stability protein PilW [Betaproteobacteria bacterium]MBL8533618.1 type IV pilus biogenesis/stability protein PilW [Betaproteobacteria bacterium]